MTKPQPPGDLLWGVPKIAEYIQRPVRTTYYLISSGRLPVKKLGPRTIVVRASELDKFLADATAMTKEQPAPVSR